MTSAESLLSECLAYAQQGLVYVEEKNQNGANCMLTASQHLMDLVPHEERNGKLYGTVNDVLSSLRTSVEKGMPGNSCDFSETLDAELLYWLPEGVQLVTIEGQQTKSLSSPTSLAIFRVEPPSAKSDSMYPVLEEAGSPQAIIQVGPWAYPLNTESSMVMQNEMGVYVVSNPTTDHPDMFVGIILPRDLSAQLEEDFVKVLKLYATVKTSEIVSEMSAELNTRTSLRIAEFLQKSGERIASKVQQVADSTTEYIAQKGDEIRASITPNDKPTNINPVIKYGVLIGYKGSKAFAKLTRAILDKVGEVGVNIGRKVASSMGGGENGANRLVSGSANIIGGGIAGASVAWISLENASKQLFRSFADETVQVVKVKYGEQASQTGHHALHAFGHTTLSAFQLWDLGPRSVAGRMARHAGIQVVHDLASEKKNMPKHKVP